MIKVTCTNKIMPKHCTGYTEEILVYKYDDGSNLVFYRHCGNGRGCFWTEIEDITRDFYGLGFIQVIQSLKRDGFSTDINKYKYRLSYRRFKRKNEKNQ